METDLIIILTAVAGIIALVSFAVLFFIQRKNMREAKKQLRFIYEHPDMNLRIRLAAPNKTMEEFFSEINKNIELFQMSQIRSEKKEKELKQEIANISHDLRTPLTSILGYMSILSEEDLTEAERAEYLSIVRKKGEVMKSIVESFYELSTVEANDLMVHNEEIYMYGVLCDILIAFHEDFERKNIEMELNLQENIEVIMLDRNILVRVISNLIQNSLRYAKSWTRISLEKENEKIVLSFSNDTDKMEASEVDRIFERTYTGDKARTYGQMGLGLSIAKKLVELQGGTINAELQNGIFEIKISFEVANN